MLEKLIFLVVILIGSCHGLYFHIGETERKCFIEEIPDETTGKMKFQAKKFFFVINFHFHFSYGQL